jgi:hypothetical protein
LLIAANDAKQVVSVDARGMSLQKALHGYFGFRKLSLLEK